MISYTGKTLVGVMGLDQLRYKITTQNRCNILQVPFYSTRIALLNDI